MALLLGVHSGLLPGTELLVSHQHPVDRMRTLEAIATACTDGQPFCLQLRFSGRDGLQRTALLVGEPVVDAHGSVGALEGMLIEIPAAEPEPEGSDRVHALEIEVSQLRTAMSSRAPIEQAKGILMLLTSCSEQVAFELLAHISSNTHRKVRDIAVAIAESASGRAPLPPDLSSFVRDVCPPTPRMH
ncbi:ANTAR domain-containing protein [Geodermatophilus ruber]|uniref:ANTAR domain-containing protein n=2 Tax=Geodermatophilus ruber TaxID=504800 RepID=A0A1I4D8F1_9ACTN|nr:ANTAR domain-containing protein [Geodermatophilus ruber]